MVDPIYIRDCGIVTPIGSGKANVARALFCGSPEGISSQYDLITGGSVPVGAVKDRLPSLSPALLDLDCRNNRLMQVALSEIAPSISEAVSLYGSNRVAVIMGTSTSGIADGEEAYTLYKKEGRWPEAFHYKQQELSGLSAFVSRYFGITGPSYTIATACSSSAKVFASARRLIRAGFVDAAIVGGADTLCHMTMNGFNALEILSPQRCNPFSANRNGITIGEGAAAFLVGRAPSPVELLGVGETSDAYHLTAPDPTGKGAQASMMRALCDAQLEPKDIAYINLHGTASTFNDAMEALAVEAVFGETAVPCGSTKGMTGHMLGATGGCEAAFLWLTMHPNYKSGHLPLHLWDGVTDSSLPKLHFVDLETGLPKKARLAMLSNSFGFGGNNVSLIFGRN
ncbi:MAG TPA: beta-ketoacyl-[acyl-carrier-protein] synthase II [Rhodospirillaceae bacterium]|nr:beta-ketoacyl-[acyl-carrier-protein] synthase II [Rhodospirillaceae bacterium]